MGPSLHVTDWLREPVGREIVSTVVVAGEERVDVRPVQAGFTTHCCTGSALVVRTIPGKTILV